MKYMKHLMALTIMLVMVGWASAETTAMNGGSVAVNEQSGGASYGYAYSFYNDHDEDQIQADILAVASTEGTGSVKVTTKVPTYVDKTLTGSANFGFTDYALTVGAEGTVDASVQGTSDKADVTAVGQIHSYAGYDDNSVFGDAYISSAIGDEWAIDTPNPFDPNHHADGLYQTGHIEGKPAGMFEASASADGEAKYSAEAVHDANQVNHVQYTLIADGGVSGKTTMEGSVGDDDAEIKGMVAAIDTYPLSHWLPSGDAAEVTEALQDIVYEWSPIAGDTPNDDVPVLAAITSGSFASMEEGSPVAAAGVANVVAVGAENDGIPADALTYASGTGAGSSEAHAKVLETPEEGPTVEYKTSASKEDTMSADVQVRKALDAATAHSLLALGSTSMEGLQASGSLVNTFAGVRRENAASSTDGSDRAFGTSFIASGKWNTWSAELTAGALVNKAEASGNLLQESPYSGMGAGAFLQYKKNQPAYANMMLVQVAASGDALEGMLHTDKADAQIVVADIMGPKAHSLGSSGWDGSGVSADLTNLHVGAQDEFVTSPYEPTTISTDIDSTKAYFWCDGTNDEQFNGPGVSSSTPVFDPAGNGQFNANIMAYLPSTTQRESLTAIATTQPSIFTYI